MKVVSFYRFLDLKDPQPFRDDLQALCDKQDLAWHDTRGD